ncbi:MAG: S41 family peptidase [Bacteroidota bacterium]
MKKTRLLFFALILSVRTYSQTCDCDKEFQFIKNYIEINYVGFKDKVTPSTKMEYDILVNKLQDLTKSANSSNYCLYIIKKYLLYFKDQHIQISSKEKQISQKDTAALRGLFNNTENIILTKETINALKNKPLSEIEGIYSSTSKTYKIAITKNANPFRDYAGVIINSRNGFWKPNQVKIELKHIEGDKYEGIVYDKFHNSKINTYTITNGVFTPDEYLKEGAKSSSNSKDDYEPYKKAEFSNTMAFLKQVNDSTLYLRIKSFDGQFAKQIETVIKDDEVLLKSKPYLILDLRYNGGGSDNAYSSLLPFIYTNPVKGIGVDVFSTPANIIAWQKMITEYDEYFSVDDKKELNDLVKRMQENPFKLISSADDGIDTLSSVYTYPKKVAVIINEGCGSTTEQFLLDAKQSNKVILIGKATAGVLDYSNVRQVDFSCMNFVLGYPTTRSRRIPDNAIDNIGIKPNISMTFDKGWLEKVVGIMTTN